MKKVTTIIFSALLTLLVAGCKSNLGNGGNTVTLSGWVSMIPGDRGCVFNDISEWHYAKLDGVTINPKFYEFVDENEICDSGKAIVFSIPVEGEIEVSFESATGEAVMAQLNEDL